MPGKRIEILLKTMGQEKPMITFRLSGLEVSRLDSDYFKEFAETFTQSSLKEHKEMAVSERCLTVFHKSRC